LSEDGNFIIGAEVIGTDGPCGHMQRLIIDPEARSLTHLSVEPVRFRRQGRLVPLGLVASSGHEVRLACTNDEFMALPVADLTEVVGPGNVHVDAPDPSLGLWKVTRDIVPPGKVEVRRNHVVNASDGVFGRLQGFTASLEDGKLTHVLVAEGVLWGRKLVAVPIGEVTALESGMDTRLTRAQLKALPLIDVEHP
jgi:hypothetical protein